MGRLFGHGLHLCCVSNYCLYYCLYYRWGDSLATVFIFTGLTAAWLVQVCHPHVSTIWEHILSENTLYQETPSIREHLLSENAFYQRTPFIRKHLVSENTFYKRTPSMREHLLSENAFYQWTPFIRERLVSENTFYERTPSIKQQRRTCLTAAWREQGLDQLFLGFLSSKRTPSIREHLQ